MKIKKTLLTFVRSIGNSPSHTPATMYTYRYPHPAVTTDCVIFGLDGSTLRVLLIRRGNAPFRDCWALPGGFLNPDEDALTGARRELQEETGLSHVAVVQCKAFSTPGRDPREWVITIAHYALTHLSEVHAADDAADARWWNVEDTLPTLAFDHRDILLTAIRQLRRQIIHYPDELRTEGQHFSDEELSTVLGALTQAEKKI